MAAATLTQAANECYSHMAVYWSDGPPSTILGRFAAFNAAVKTAFPDDGTQAARTVSNWLVVGKQVEGVLPALNPNTADLNAMAQYVFRLCYAGDNAKNATPARITAAQAAALLAAYNAHLD